MRACLLRDLALCNRHASQPSSLCSQTMEVGLHGSVSGICKGAAICALIAEQRLDLCYRESIQFGKLT
jgi:hypothetical protein